MADTARRFVLMPSGRKGPYSVAELRQMAADGYVSPQVMTEREDGGQREPLGLVLDGEPDRTKVPPATESPVVSSADSYGRTVSATESGKGNDSTLRGALYVLCVLAVIGAYVCVKIGRSGRLPLSGGVGKMPTFKKSVTPSTLRQQSTTPTSPNAKAFPPPSSRTPASPNAKAFLHPTSRAAAGKTVEPIDKRLARTVYDEFMASGLASWDRKDYDRAAGHFTDAAAKAKARLSGREVSEAFCARGRMRAAQGDRAKARADWDLAVAADPANELPLLCRALGRTGWDTDLDGGIADASEAIRLNRKNAWAYYLRSRCHALKLDPVQAQEDIAQARLLDPAGTEKRLQTPEMTGESWRELASDGR